MSTYMADTGYVMVGFVVVVLLRKQTPETPWLMHVPFKHRVHNPMSR